jgi:stage II sporulation protein AA (anti-sigma F factor antagonist)
MSEEASKYLSCPVVVLRLTESQVTGDTVADALRDELLGAYQGSGAVHVVVDLQQVGFLSSAGLRPLLTLNRSVRERGGRLLLCGLSPHVEEVFTATRLVSTHGAAPAAFEKFPDVPSAVAGLYQAGP